MKNLKKLSVLVAVLFISATSVLATKPNIHILATGGTIAGTGSSVTSTNYTA